jgi:hypothetical protein
MRLEESANCSAEIRKFKVRHDSARPRKLAIAPARPVVRADSPGPVEVKLTSEKPPRAAAAPHDVRAALLRDAASNRCQLHDAIPSASAMPQLNVVAKLSRNKMASRDAIGSCAGLPFQPLHRRWKFVT